MFEYWDSKSKQRLKDPFYAGDFLNWAYGSFWGRIFLKLFFSRKIFNSLYGAYKSSTLSRAKIKSDIDQYRLNMDEFESSDYRSYKQFFLRRFKPEARPFESSPGILPAFSEGRYLGYESVSERMIFPIKGSDINLSELLRDDKLAQEFAGGPMLICRLCPLDYHHYHYPDNGQLLSSYRISGRYHSVNLIALKYHPRVFLENERVINVFQTENFGKLVYIEVGAMCVGKIIQEHRGDEFHRGEVKGHFDFGGSTLILLGKADCWKPSDEILEQTALNIETLVPLGQEIGRCR